MEERGDRSDHFVWSRFGHEINPKIKRENGEEGVYPKPVAPVAYQVLLEPGIGHFREFEPRRVLSLRLLREHKWTCGKRESVSYQHSMKHRRAVGLLNPMRDKN